jgi:hypothetical protein
VTAPVDADAGANPIPLFAYYYIWFDTSSWKPSKMIDFPLLGTYSSDNAQVMDQHIQWAKSAGITGFIVSWKHTERLDRRIAQLTTLADKYDFKLAVIYQGLDFERRPQPVETIARDLDYFIASLGNDRPFDYFEKPLVIWGGSWAFSPNDIQSVTDPRRSRLLILSSEKNVAGFERLADAVDGDAYYWSSVQPSSNTSYPRKLKSMGEAVHARSGLWVAPAAPGYDSRLLGGETVVARRDGETLRLEMATALASSPDLIGLISWNEFSENSHVEPSDSFGKRYIEILSEIRGSEPPPIMDLDSSESGQGPADPTLAVVLALGIVAAVVLMGMVAIVVRNRGPRK